MDQRFGIDQTLRSIQDISDWKSGCYSLSLILLHKDVDNEGIPGAMENVCQGSANFMLHGCWDVFVPRARCPTRPSGTRTLSTPSVPANVRRGFEKVSKRVGSGATPCGKGRGLSTRAQGECECFIT